jgi:hypothetical protein
LSACYLNFFDTAPNKCACALVQWDEFVEKGLKKLIDTIIKHSEIPQKEKEKFLDGMKLISYFNFPDHFFKRLAHLRKVLKLFNDSFNEDDWKELPKEVKTSLWPPKDNSLRGARESLLERKSTL